MEEEECWGRVFCEGSSSEDVVDEGVVEGGCGAGEGRSVKGEILRD